MLSNAKKITALVSELRGDISIISAALKKVSALDENLDVESIEKLLSAKLCVRVECKLKLLNVFNNLVFFIL